MNLRTELLPHQVDAVCKIRVSRVGALFMEMGTGKSRVSIELAKEREEKISKVVWFCPVSLKETVKQEIVKHTDTPLENIHSFNGCTREDNVPKVFWYIIGIESMSSSNRAVLTANKIIDKNTMVILDESSYIKGHSSIRTLRITELSKRARYRLALTGTPISQGVVDLFAQMRFLSPKILGYNSFYTFAANHLEYHEEFPDMIVRSHNTEYIAAKIKPYVYQVTKEECLDLPKKLYDTRYFCMTGDQRDYYEIAKQEILDEFLEEWDDVAIFRLFSALQQIVCGHWNRRVGLGRGRPKEYKFIRMPHERVKALLSVVADIPQKEKIIIWTKFQYDVDQVRKALARNYGEDSIAVFHGGLSEKERNRQINLFRHEARFFLATQSSGGHGLTLNEANNVIFYNNGFKYSERLQAEDRCHRIGQDRPVTYVDIVCAGSIDERINRALTNKESAVNSFKKEVDRVKDKKAKAKELIKAL